MTYRKRGEILLDPNHGVNPGLNNCFYCNEAKEVILYGKLPAGSPLREADGSALRTVVLNMEPCAKCADFMKTGVILVSVRPPESDDDKKNPWRTGGWCVVRDEAISRLFEEELAGSILLRRFAFLLDDTWDEIGLPRGEWNDESSGTDAST